MFHESEQGTEIMEITGRRIGEPNAKMGFLVSHGYFQLLSANIFLPHLQNLLRQ